MKWQRWLLALIYVPAYVALDWISYIQPVLKLGITPWSPQTGLTVAFLLWNGPRWAVFTAIAAFLAEMLVRDGPAGVAWLVLASVWIAASYALFCAVLGLSVVRNATQALAPAVRFLLAVIIAAMFAAFGYVGTFVLAHSLPLSSIGGSFVRYWIGDVNGILMLAPLLLALPQARSALSALRANWPQAAAQVSVLVLFIWLLFGLDDSDPPALLLSGVRAHDLDRGYVGRLRGIARCAHYPGRHSRGHERCADRRAADRSADPHGNPDVDRTAAGSGGSRTRTSAQ
ncbi:MAG: MASE1 domain-containing protein [Pseudomonadota bacterium]